MAEYYVVLGDVVHSREIEDREAFQDRLAETCARFSASEREDVYGDFTILKGVDEFGGVLQSLANLYEVVTAFQDALRPHGVRIVVASGSIDVGLTTFDVEKMDGEAFHRASERLEEIEDGPLSFDLLVDDAATGRAIADEINLLLRRREEWTDRQREVIDVRQGVDTQSAAAERLGVTQQAVSNVLSGADWPLVETVEERLRKTLREYAAFRANETEVGPSDGEQSSVTSGDASGFPEAGAESGSAASSSGSSGLESVGLLAPGSVDDLATLMETALRRDDATELIGQVRSRLEDVIGPILTSSSDDEATATTLEFLARLAERTTGPASEDVRLWTALAAARWLGEPLAWVHPGGDYSPGDRYSTGLGFVLAGEPETAVQFFRHAWRRRDELDGREREYALAAGTGLLGCAELLGPSIVEDPAAVRRELAAANDALREPARQFLAYVDGGASVDEVEAAVHDDALEQFARLEAEAFAALAAQLERQNR
ncbi:hypothetical protein BRC81_09150 [Halobacteriales archaeon QS_1_68_20]|nr:MAG: hypothetical protein BRC81_09150 [Halobacteriales archaeon QS_1_68_20]